NERCNYYNDFSRFNISCAFLAAGWIYERSHSYMLKDLGGMAKYVPVFATFFMISAMASVGLPGLSGFVGEFLSLLGTFKTNVWFAAAAGVALVVGAGYTLRLYHKTMFMEELIDGKIIHKWRNTKDMTASEFLSFLPLIILMFAIGIYPKWWVDLINTTSLSILSKFIGG
ncbi:proton-conducting transporter membrane subunit, partial [Hydrogenivirga sp. 128-5-R1-1]|uniref:proton-conducting transporter transmembrane domain-containing protein n=1 Tax=Hydrogenivirga sp. 128-5-R1-1 TaxID=392423 RepID=UPI00015F0D74